MTITFTGLEIQEIINWEIAKELLLEINKDITDNEVSEIYKICEGNPFNAPILYKIIKISQNEL